MVNIRERTDWQRSYPAGTAIIQQGDDAGCFYIVLDGTLDVQHRTTNGRDHHLARLGKGDYFGEVALLFGGRRTATVRAITPVIVVEINRNAFYELLSLFSGVKEQFEMTAYKRWNAVAALHWRAVLG